jgi:hypothetical protein
MIRNLYKKTARYRTPTKHWITLQQRIMLHISNQHGHKYWRSTDRKKVQLEDVPEAQDTFMQSHECGRQESRQSTQTADIGESTVVSDKQSLPQHSDGDMNTTVSAIQNTSEERRYIIRSWLTHGKEDTLSEEKRDLGHLKREPGTMTLCFINIEGL